MMIVLSVTATTHSIGVRKSHPVISSVVKIHILNHLHINSIYSALNSNPGNGTGNSPEQLLNEIARFNLCYH